MKPRMILVATVLISGCASRAEPPTSAVAVAPQGMAVGQTCLLYTDDPSYVAVMVAMGNDREFAPFDVGTRVVFLGSIPAKGEDRGPEVRVKILEGEQAGRIGFASANHVRPDASDASAAP